jgi:hypothetical protein
VTGFISSFDPERSSPVLGSRMKHLGSMSFQKGASLQIVEVVRLELECGRKHVVL